MLNVEKLKKLIKDSGISQAYICRELGKHRHYITDIYNGVTTPSENQIQIMARILHVSAEYLTDKDEPDIKKETAVADDLDREILELFSSLSAEQKIRFLDLLKSLKPPTA